MLRLALFLNFEQKEASSSSKVLSEKGMQSETKVSSSLQGVNQSILSSSFNPILHGGVSIFCNKSLQKTVILLQSTWLPFKFIQKYLTKI